MNAYGFRKLIPDYWFSQTENPERFEDCDQYLDGKIKSIPNGKSFMFLTDPHIRGCNAMNSPAIIGYIREMTNVKKVVQGGDILHREPTKYMGAQEIIKYTNIMRSVAGEDYLPVWGNHDINTANAPIDDVATHRIPYTEIDKILFAHLKDRVTEDISEKIAYLDCSEEDREQIIALGRLHYYVDDNAAKMRYIIMETGCQVEAERNGCVTKHFGISNNEDLVMQYDWLYETLMSTPEDYDILVTGHAMLGYEKRFREIMDGPMGVCEMISAFHTRSKLSLYNRLSWNEKLCKFYKAGNHEYDFSTRKGNSRVVVLGADTHHDIMAVADYDENGNFVYKGEYDGSALPKSAVVVTSTVTDGYGATGSKLYPNCILEKGTTNEHAIDVVTVLPDGDIAFTRIGAGDNRKISYVK